MRTRRPPKPRGLPATPRHREQPASSSVETLELEPPSLDTIPGTRADFERAVGRAITNWQQIEEALCNLFVEIANCANPDIPKAVYWTFHDFGDKLTMVRNAARLALDETQYSYFRALRSRLVRASQKRNAIAHYHVSIGGLAAPDDREIKMEIWLTPNLFDPNQRFRKEERDAKPGWMGTTRIKNASTEFLRLARTIDWLKSEIHQPPKPPE